MSVSEAKSTLSRLVEPGTGRRINRHRATRAARGGSSGLLPDQEPLQLGFVASADYWMSEDFDEPMPDLIELFKGCRQP